MDRAAAARGSGGARPAPSPSLFGSSTTRHVRLSRNNSGPNLGGRKYIYSTVPQPMNFCPPSDCDMTEVFQTVLDVPSLHIEEVCLAIDGGTVPQNLMAKLTKPFYVRSEMNDSEGERYFLIVRTATPTRAPANSGRGAGAGARIGAPSKPDAWRNGGGSGGGGGAGGGGSGGSGCGGGSGGARSPLAGSDGIHEKQKEAKKPMFLKKLAFEISLSYNRMRYNTFDEIFFPDGSPTGVILGQLPSPDHVRDLVRNHNVKAVVSCVEDFELQRFDINFRGVGLRHKVLNAVDFSALDVALLEDGVHFIRSFFGMRPRSVGPPRTDRKVYVHCKAGRSRSCAIVIGFLVSLAPHPEFGVFDPLRAYKLVQGFRSHVSVGKGKFLEIHYYFLRSKVRRGLFLKQGRQQGGAAATHRWLHQAVDLCDAAKEPIKGLRREKEKLQKLEDDVRRNKVMLLQADAVPRQRAVVRALKQEVDRLLAAYARLCGDEYFRPGTKFELKLRDFFLHYNPDKILSIAALVQQYSEQELVDMIKADYNYDLRGQFATVDDATTSGDGDGGEGGGGRSSNGEGGSGAGGGDNNSGAGSTGATAASATGSANGSAGGDGTGAPAGTAAATEDEELPVEDVEADGSGGGSGTKPGAARQWSRSLSDDGLS